MSRERNSIPSDLVKVIKMLTNLVVFLLIAIVLLLLVIINYDSLNKMFKTSSQKQQIDELPLVSTDNSKNKIAAFWKAPDISEITDSIKSRKSVMATSNSCMEIP